MTLTDESSIDYGKRMHKALRGLVVELMNEVAERGLPGNHHFFVTFETAHPEADIPAWMVEKYPDEMTIVLQHSFEDLAVRADDFTVTLRFSDVPYTVTVPFDAIRTFVDPSVEFGLRFDSMISGEAPAEDAPSEPEEAAEPTPSGDEGVISLDAFRKT